MRGFFSGMALRSPQNQSGKIRENVLDYEIAQEQAAALGRLSRALEAALTNLAAYDAAAGVSDKPPGSPRKGTRTELLEAAGYALCCFIIQREACGLRDQATVIRQYRVPAEVRNRMGVFPGSHLRL
jgi:hypothetical protein